MMRVGVMVGSAPQVPPSRERRRRKEAAILGPNQGCMHFQEVMSAPLRSLGAGVKFSDKWFRKRLLESGSVMVFASNRLIVLTEDGRIQAQAASPSARSRSRLLSLINVLLVWRGTSPDFTWVCKVCGAERRCKLSLQCRSHRHFAWV